MKPQGGFLTHTVDVKGYSDVHTWQSVNVFRLEFSRPGDNHRDTLGCRLIAEWYQQLTELTLTHSSVNRALFLYSPSLSLRLERH